MAKGILTIVYDKVEAKLDPVIAAAVNELHKLGHVVSEVRVMGDSGEAKVALNQVVGIVDTAADTAVADTNTDIVTAVTDTATEPSDTVENKAADGSSPVAPIAGVPDVAPEQTIAEKRDALLEQLEALDKEEEAADIPVDGDTTTTTTADPTPGTSTPTTAS